MRRFKDDFAQDDIWVAKNKSFAHKIGIVENPKANDLARKLVKQTVAVEKGAKVVGRIFYFLPKNLKGQIVNKPTRLLRVTSDGTSTPTYYEAKDFNAEKAVSSFTGLDDIRTQMDYYGANGVVDLPNMENMDESISNMMCNYYGFDGISGVARAKSRTGRFINVDGFYRRNGFYTRGTVKKVVDVKVVPFYCGRTNTRQQRNLLIFDDGTAGTPNKWENVSNMAYSNLTNQSLLDGLTENTSLLEFEGGYSNLTNQSLLDGLTENTSLLEFEGGYSNLTNQSLLDGLTENTSLLEFEGNNEDLVPAKTPTPYVVTVSGANGLEEYVDADGDTEYSNGIGDWFKGVFSGKKKLNAIPALADPNVFVVDAETMQKAYEESGSGKSYQEWINSESGKAIVGAVAQFANILVNKPTDGLGGGDSGGQVGGQGGVQDKEDESETTILGMSPVTFGIVALGVIVLGSIVTYRIIKSKNK